VNAAFAASPSGRRQAMSLQMRVAPFGDAVSPPNAPSNSGEVPGVSIVPAGQKRNQTISATAMAHIVALPILTSTVRSKRWPLCS
jgi:hypothetical protein